MSNGLYQRLECVCGTVCLLVCGSPLGGAVDPDGESVTLWPAEAVQVGEGVEDLVSGVAEQGGVVQSCRRCGEAMLTEHDEAGVIVLPWASDDENAVQMTSSLRAALKALGYRFPATEND